MIVTWFEDKESGTKINRENLNALNKAIFHGDIKTVIVWKLDRIAEIEFSNIKERQAAGIAVAKQNGVYRGRKFGTLKAKPERAKELKAQGLKNTEIIQVL